MHAFTWRYAPGGLKARQKGTDIIFEDADGREVYRLSAPYMTCLLYTSSQIGVYVLKDDSAQSIEDAKSYTFGTLSNLDTENTQACLLYTSQWGSGISAENGRADRSDFGCGHSRNGCPRLLRCQKMCIRDRIQRLRCSVMMAMRSEKAI